MIFNRQVCTHGWPSLGGPGGTLAACLPSSVIKPGAAAVVEIGEALKRFVEKDEKTALSDAYNRILQATQEAALDDLGRAADADAGAAADATPEDDDAAERHVIDAVHAAGQRLQAEAIAKFSEADVRLKLAEEGAGAEDEGADGDENMVGQSALLVSPMRVFSCSGSAKFAAGGVSTAQRLPYAPCVHCTSSCGRSWQIDATLYLAPYATWCVNGLGECHSLQAAQICMSRSDFAAQACRRAAACIITTRAYAASCAASRGSTAAVCDCLFRVAS